MKTINLKSAVLAAASLLVITINAQNTKEISFTNNPGTTSGKVINEFNNSLSELNVELTIQTNKLATLLKFNPAKTEVRELSDYSENENLENITNQMEELVKFRLSEVDYTVENESLNAINKITDELSEQVKYYPASIETEMMIENDDLLKEITNDLSEKVKYKPTEYAK